MEIDDFASLRRKAFESVIKQGMVFRLKNEPPFKSEVFHVFIILNKNWQTGEALIINNGTTQILKRYHLVEQQGLDPDATIVVIPGGKYSFFPKDTAIDCSDIFEVDLNEIHFESSSRFISIDECLDDKDLEKILTAIRNNPLISNNIKDKL